MKSITLACILALLSSFTFGQEIKMTDDARKKYTTKNAKTESSPASQKKSDSDDNAATPPLMVYAALEVTRMVNDRSMRVVLDKGSNALNSRIHGMDISELEKFERGGINLESDVDLLNYVSERGWEVVSIAPAGNPADPNKLVTRIYLRKPFAQ